MDSAQGTARRFSTLVRATQEMESRTRRNPNSTMLTQAEIDECKTAFRRADKDETGSIDPPQLQRALAMLGQHATEDEMYQIIAEVDKTKSGALNLNDFLLLMEAQKQRCQRFDADRDIVHAFIAVGGARDKGGEVSVNQLQKVINDEFELEADVKKLVERVHAGRTTGSTRISFEEFQTMLGVG